MKTINEKLGIKIDYSMKNGKYEEAFFYSANGIELNAFCMDDIKEYQEDIKEETQILSNAKTKEDIINYLTRYAGWGIVKDFKEEDFENSYNENENSYLLDFIEFKIAVIK